MARRAAAPSSSGRQGTSRQQSTRSPSAAASESKMRRALSAAMPSSGRKNMPTAYSPSPPRKTPASAAQRAKSACGRRVRMPTPSPGGARGVAAGAVRQPFDDGQRIGYGAVGGLSAQVDHRAHAAGFVFHLRIVERTGACHGVFLHCYVFDASIFAAISGSFRP